jgi:hypothetical protein
MSTWTKLKGERILAGIDWTARLNGASITGTPAIEVGGVGDLSATFQATSGSVTKFWLDEGVSGQTVTVTIDTSAGEILEFRGQVLVS